MNWTELKNSVSSKILNVIISVINQTLTIRKQFVGGLKLRRNNYNHEKCRECVHRHTVHTQMLCKACGEENDYHNRKTFADSKHHVSENKM